MNTIELKSFLMVYEYRSYSLAAKRLFVTQSTVSKRVNNLENELKIKLFETRGSMIFPTMEGQLLIPYARLVLHTLCDASVNLNSPALTEISIIIGVGPVPCFQFLPLFMDYLQENQISSPNFHFKQLHKKDIVNFLQNGLIDIALTTKDSDLTNSIVSQDIYEEDVYIVVSPQHELAHEKKLDLKKLSQYTAILTEKGMSMRDNVERYFARRNLQLLIKHEMFSPLAIKKLVKRGLGWSLLPIQYIDDELVKLELKDYSDKMKMVLCWYCHENRAETKIINYLGQLLKEAVPYIQTHKDRDE